MFLFAILFFFTKKWVSQFEYFLLPHSSAVTIFVTEKRACFEKREKMRRSVKKSDIRYRISKNIRQCVSPRGGR